MDVLIVDDDLVTLRFVGEALSRAGYQVATANNGRQALELLRLGKFHLVVSDWEMPEMTGPELCRAIRSEDMGGYVYVILLTGRNSPEERVEGLRAGADDFVAKPYNKEELLARLGAGTRVLALETREVAIFAMAKLAESRDSETGAHLERVRVYCRTLAQDLAGAARFGDQITPEYARLIYQTSPLHDIGKVGIPDSVLLKPGRLNDREFEIMKSHTTVGASTLEAALRQFPGIPFLQMGRDIALTHHERYDGTGYPRQIKGDDIPLCGRIMALADVYDALTARRVYKAPLVHEVAKSMILAESGRHFDPDIVEAFIRTEERFQAICSEYAMAGENGEI